MLLQLFFGERADCARRCTWKWLEHLNPEEGVPVVNIPKVNGKTKARCIALYQPFARLLWHWKTKNALQGESGTRWPEEGQELEDDSPLFPGYNYTGQKRVWGKPISERAFLYQVRQAVDLLQKDCKTAGKTGGTTVFEGCNFKAIGTHSFKKTAVTLLAESTTSWSIISAITGTTIPMLQATYDVATTARQSRALDQCYSAIFPQLHAGRGQEQPPRGHAGDDAAVSHYCGKCGAKRHCRTDAYCRNCGELH